VHRREFLLLRHPSAPRIVELSCERLHMAYLDLQTATNPSAPREDELSFAEPAAIRRERDVGEWLRDLQAQLGEAEIVTVVGEEWLRPASLRAHVDAILATLAGRGVRVERTQAR
jgi:hypothetical protein